MISFFIIYMLLATLLMKAFSGMSQMTEHTLGNVGGFMKALIPSYFAAAVFAGNSAGGLVFYESALLLLALVQWVQKNVLLPAVQLYVLFLLLNHLSRDDRLSKMAELLYTLIEWTRKTLLAAAIGLGDTKSDHAGSGWPEKWYAEPRGIGDTRCGKCVWKRQ